MGIVYHLHLASFLDEANRRKERVAIQSIRINPFPGIPFRSAIITYSGQTLFHFIVDQILIHVIVLIFTVLQWRLLQYSKKENSGEITFEELRLSPWIKVILTFIGQMWDNYGLFLCYLGMFLVGFLVHDFNGLAYVIFALICLVMHMAVHPVQWLVRLIWLPIVLFSGLVMLIRYVMQFDYFWEMIHSAFNESSLSNCIDLQPLPTNYCRF